MGKITFSFKTDIKRYQNEIKDLYAKQIPFATALTLTRAAAKLGDHIVDKVKETMPKSKKWTLKRYIVKKGKKPSPGAAFFSTLADYKMPLDKIFATVGTIDWKLTQQMDKETTDRTVHSKNAKYLWLPLNIKMFNSNRSRKKYIEALHTPKSRVFVVTSQGKHAGERMVVKRKQIKTIAEGRKRLKRKSPARTRKNNGIEGLYLLENQQNIKPQFNWEKEIKKNANKFINQEAKAAFQYAVNTRKR
jgi:hypothetical protein